MVFGLHNVPDHTADTSHAVPGWGGTEILWSGKVVLDPSITGRLGKPKRLHGTDEYTIRDDTYGRPDNAQFDNPDISSQFPNDITVVCKDLKSDVLECVAFKAYASSKRSQDITAKGVFLDSARNIDRTDVARLALVRFDSVNMSGQTQLGHDISKGAPLHIRKLGCAALASGSQGSPIVLARDAPHSVTILFVASDRYPFEAVSYTKGGSLLVRCTGAGLDSRIESGRPMDILDSKLALGKLTPQEYATLKEAMRNSD